MLIPGHRLRARSDTADELRVFWLIGILLAFSMLLIWQTVGGLGLGVMPDALVCSTFGAVILVSIYGCARSVSVLGASAGAIFWFFNLLFFGVAPLSQYLTDVWLFMRPVRLVETNCYVLLYQAIFALTYRAVWRKPSVWAPPRPGATIAVGRLVAAVGVCFIGVVMLVASQGIEWEGGMVMQAAGGYERGPSAMLLTYSLRPFVSFLLIYVILWWRDLPRRTPAAWGILLSAAIAQFLVNPPTSDQRFLVFAFYLGLLIVLWPPTKRRATAYLFALMLSLFGANYISQARVEMGISEEGRKTFEREQYLCSPNFDSYGNLAHGIDYASEAGHAYGEHVLAAALFFVPRSYWPDKPIGTGGFLFHEHLAVPWNYATNVAAPPLADFYLDFWLIGVVALAVSLGLLCAHWDRRVRDHLGAGKPRWSIDSPLWYPSAVGLFVFLQRGDLLSGAGYAAGFAAAYLVCRRLVLRRA